MNNSSEHINYDAEKIMQRSFKTVENKALAPVKNETEIGKSDFEAVGKNFWLKYENGKYYQAYTQGCLNGTYNNRIPSFNALIETILCALKNIVRMQCEAEDKTAQDVSLHFETIEKLFKILEQDIDKLLTNNMDGEEATAYLHAVIDSFIATNIKKEK